MSSHHFVKEGQEPALLILDALSLELAEPLLEWAPLVIVAEPALLDVLQWGIKVDVVLVNADHTEKMRHELLNHFPVEIIPYHNQAEILPIAFDFLIKRKQNAVNIMTKTPDSLLEVWGTFSQEIHVALFDHQIKWLCIATGTYEKWLPAKSRLQLRITESKTVNIIGLSPYQDHWVAAEDGITIIQSEQTFWIGEYQ